MMEARKQGAWLTSGTHVFGLFFCLWVLVVCPVVRADDDLQDSEIATAVEVDFGVDKVIPIRRYDHDLVDIEIDGHLTEAAWVSPPLFNRLVVTEPDTLADPPYKTEFRMFYTEKGVYVSFDMEQPADTIIKRYAARDDFSVKRDRVSFTLDTSGGGLYGYWMNLSLGDVQMDGTVKPERRFSKRWDGAWYGATQRTEKGWAAEYFVPWSQMAMPKASGVRRIGVYIEREVAHLNEKWSWPALPKSQPKFLSALQPLSFEGVDLRRQWSLFPYASTTYDHVDDEFRFKAGFEVFWRPSSNFQLNATVNPDFGTVEADDVIVNLTANETYFPEKRLFFLEGQEIFNTTPRAEAEYGPRAVFVNTRRIGGRPELPELPLDEEFSDREALKLVEVLGAAKATGQIGSFRYGLLAAFEDDTDYLHADEVHVQEGREFGVVRVLYEDSRGAAYRGLGFISTLVRHPNSDAIAHGVDFHRLSNDGSWDVNGHFLYSDLTEEGEGYGAFVDVDYVPRQGLLHTLQLTHYDDVLDINDLGYLSRNDISSGRYNFNWIKSGLTKIRNVEAGTVLDYAENGEGYRVSNSVAAYSDFTFNTLHMLNLFAWYSPARFDDQNSFDNGTFEVEAAPHIEIAYRTDTSKKVSGVAKLAYNGEDLGGRGYQLSGGLTWRPRHNITLSAKLNYQDKNGWLLHQEDEHFTTFDGTLWQPEVKFDYFFTARQHFRMVFQWVGIRAVEDEFFSLEEGGTSLIPGPKPPGETDDFSISELTFQVRYRWQIAPLSDLYVVYTKGDSRWTDLTDFDELIRDSWRQPLGDQLVVKLRYRFGS